MGTSKNELFTCLVGGQFEPVCTGQFEPELGGQIKPVWGGQLHRILHTNVQTSNQENGMKKMQPFGWREIFIRKVI